MAYNGLCELIPVLYHQPHLPPLSADIELYSNTELLIVPCFCVFVHAILIFPPFLDWLSLSHPSQLSSDTFYSVIHSTNMY